MNKIGADCQDLIYKYTRNLKYMNVMKELKDCSELEVIKYDEYDDYYNTEILHFNLSKNKLSVKINSWTLEHDPTIHSVNSQIIIDSIQNLIDNGCPYNIAFKFKYRDDRRDKYH